MVMSQGPTVRVRESGIGSAWLQGKVYMEGLRVTCSFAYFHGIGVETSNRDKKLKWNYQISKPPPRPKSAPPRPQEPMAAG